MKIIVVGGTEPHEQAIGQAVVTELEKRHEIVIVGGTNPNVNVNVDITERPSIESMYKNIGKFDALISITAEVFFAALTEIKENNFQSVLKHTLMGQVNLVLIGLDYINEKGSFTLTSGILNHDPIQFGASGAMVYGALDGFVKSAAIEMPKNVRINIVSPTVIAESMHKPMHKGDYFRGYQPVSAAQVALAYSKSAEGAQTGQIYRVGY